MEKGKQVSPGSLSYASKGDGSTLAFLYAWNDEGLMCGDVLWKKESKCPRFTELRFEGRWEYTCFFAHVE
jgi:hypothetical protein